MRTDTPALAQYGMDQDRYQADAIPLQTYIEMLDRDPVVALAEGFVQRSTLRRVGDYSHDREDVTDWVERLVMPAVKRDLRRLQTALYFGVAIAQPRYDVTEDGELRLAELIGCHPARYWYGRGFERDDEGRLARVWIQGPGWLDLWDQHGGRQIIHYASGDRWGSPWGSPVARRAYTAWYIKRRLVGFEAIGLEKHGLGTAIFKSSDPDALEAYVDAWASMGSENALGIGATDELQVERPGWSGASPYSQALSRLDGHIFNSFMLPHLLLSEAQHGTRAQASVALEAYIMAESEIAARLADLVHHQIVKPAVSLRFGRVRGDSGVVVRDATEPDRAQWATILSQLASFGAFDPAADDQLAWLGDIFEIPTADIQTLIGTGGVGPEI